MTPLIIFRVDRFLKFYKAKKNGKKKKKKNEGYRTCIISDSSKSNPIHTAESRYVGIL